MNLLRELHAPAQKAAKAQKIETTEEQQPQMAATEAAAESEAEQEEADQMRDTSPSQDTTQKPTSLELRNFTSK